MKDKKTKKDSVSKFAKLAGDIRSIYLILALFFTGMVWASDVYHMKYLKVGEYKASELRKEIKSLNNEVADLKIEATYAVKERDKQRIKELIIRKKLQIQNLKGL